MWIVELSNTDLIVSTVLTLLIGYIFVKGIIQMAAKDNLNTSIANLETVSANLVSAIGQIPAGGASENELQAIADRVNNVAAILGSQVDKIKPANV